jgi:uncharacterized alpha-E superfamily protein
MSTLSRVADSLYWMSRYLERAEHIARLVDVNLHGMIDQHPEDSKKRLLYLLETIEATIEPDLDAVSIDYEVIRISTFERSNLNSIYSCIAAARENARHVREQISTEMWMQINRLYLFMKNVNLEKLWKQQPHEFFVQIKEGIMLFQGVTDSTMSHSEGWHFIYVGRFMERTYAITNLLDRHLLRFTNWKENPDTEVEISEYMDWVSLLKSCTAFEAYCRINGVTLTPKQIVGYLLLDGEFPHSVRFALETMKRALNVISELTETKKFGYINRLVGKAVAHLDYSTQDEVIEDPHKLIELLQEQCGAIHDAVYTTYISYPIESAS